MVRDLKDIQGVPNTEWVKLLLMEYKKMSKYPPDEVSQDYTVDAFVEFDQLLAMCPSCNNAMYVDRDDLRFFCANNQDNCFNGFAGGKWVRVVLPEDGIERLLAIRPMIKNRNYYLGETVESLKAENVKYGVPV